MNLTPRDGQVALVALEPGAGPEVARRVTRALRIPDAVASRACRWYDVRRLSVPLSGVGDPDVVARAAREPGVERLVLVRRDLTGHHPDQSDESDVALRHGVTVTAGGLSVMAGPCSIESASQIGELAEAVKAAGGDILRGGAFKPRSSPFGFGGVGAQGLEWLARAGSRSGLPTVSEALDVEMLDAVAEHVDIVQIGARNMHNFPLLFRAGHHPSGRPVLLKRGFGATIEELLMAAEYVLVGRMFAGITEPRLILCERGIRTFEPATRFTLDVAAIPALRLRTHLPVIADPSHAAGDRRLVPALAMAAAAAGASGLLLEAHAEPDRAWCDGDQSLGLEDLRDLLPRLRAIDVLRRPTHSPPVATPTLEPARSV